MLFSERFSEPGWSNFVLGFPNKSFFQLIEKQWTQPILT